MVSTILLTTGTSLVTLSIVPYIKDILQDRAKPRVISWAIWTLLLGLMAVVSWQEGQISSAVLATASTLACLTVSLLAVRYASMNFTYLERWSLFGAAVGIALWLLFDNPMLMLAAAITVDAIAYLPTFVNGWYNPYHESMSMFATSAIGSWLVLLAALLGHTTLHGLVYPLYSVTFGSIMIGILLTRRRVEI